jgi:putative ABC transport system substrate-binding protein
MRCRTIALICLALGLLAASLPVEVQPAEQVRRIGYLAGGHGGGSGQYLLDAFQHGLRELGWVEGQNLVIEWRLPGDGTNFSPTSRLNWSVSGWK